MKNRKHSFIITILFIVVIVGCGLLTVINNPVKIAGGLVRGYLNAENEKSVFTRIESGFAEFENRMNTFFIMHDSAINAYGGMQRLFGHTHVDDVEPGNSIVKLKNGYLVFENTGKTYDDSDHVNYVANLNAVCKKLDVDFLYVSRPSKGRDAALFPNYYPEKGDDNTDETVAELRMRGVTALDLTELIAKNKLKVYDYFYKTDHHWLPQAGLWGSKEIALALNDIYGYDLDVSLLDESQYNIEHYGSVFLGSQGRRVGKFYTGMDDFDIIYPKFETSYDVEYYQVDGYYSGDFSDVFIFRDQLNLDRPLTLDTNDYDVYMRGNHTLIKCYNHKTSNNQKCLILINSFGCVLAPYLSLEFSQLDCIDVRGLTNQTVEEYITETKPDVVIYMLNNLEDQQFVSD